MINYNNLKLFIFIFLSCSFFASCSSQSPPLKERFFWPPPPDRPRIEWLNAYSSQHDLGKGRFENFFDAVVGEDLNVSLEKPIEVKSDPKASKFYVADIGLGSILVFDLGKKQVRSLGLGPRAYPLGMVLDSDGNLYLLETTSKRILIFDRAEKPKGSLPIKEYAKAPVGLAINSLTKQIFVSDKASNKIIALDLTGKLLFSFGGPGEDNGLFNLPISIATNSNGEIIVADSFNARVQIFDNKGKFIRKFGKRGDGPGDFQLIKSIAVDSDDNIYVVDGRSHRIKVFNETGQLLLVLGDFYAVSSSGKTAPGGFSVPVSIDIDSQNRIFVVDQLNRRVQVFQYLPEVRDKAFK